MTFEGVDSQPLSAFNVIVCYSYGSYSNLADLCDSENPLAISMVAGENEVVSEEQEDEVVNEVLGDLIRQAPIAENFESTYSVTLGDLAIKQISFANPLAVSI